MVLFIPPSGREDYERLMVGIIWLGRGCRCSFGMYGMVVWYDMVMGYCSMYGMVLFFFYYGEICILHFVLCVRMLVEAKYWGKRGDCGGGNNKVCIRLSSQPLLLLLGHHTQFTPPWSPLTNPQKPCLLKT